MKINPFFPDGQKSYVPPFCETVNLMADTMIMSASSALPDYNVSEEEDW